MEAADQLYVPTNKSWRLNERMYGGLTGLDKKEQRPFHADAGGKARPPCGGDGVECMTGVMSPIWMIWWWRVMDVERSILEGSDLFP